MCEFKIIKENDGSQILEDIVVLSYTEDNDLVCKDVLGLGEKLESALILNVNTLNQECIILEHPLISDFINLMRKATSQLITKTDFEDFQNKVEKIKAQL